jgi:hypothetical protein
MCKCIDLSAQPDWAVENRRTPLDAETRHGHGPPVAELAHPLVQPHTNVVAERFA